MFSIQKILVLVAVITAVLGFFRVVGQLQAMQKQREKDERVTSSKKRAAPKDKADKSVELKACPKCGDFVPNGQHSC